MFKRSPISYSVVRYTSIFDPKEMISADAELLQNKMTKLIHYFVKLSILYNISSDKAFNEIIHFIQNHSALNLVKLNSVLINTCQTRVQNRQQILR